LSVTAEGVEVQAQVEAALAHGVDQAPGFLYSKAMPAEKVPTLLGKPVGLVA